MINDLNVFVFLWYIIKNWSYNIGITKLQNNMNCKNFKVTFLWKTLWIIEDKEIIKKVLGKESSAKLTFVNRNFFASHYHNYGIGNIDYEKGECLWKGLHNTLSSALVTCMSENNLENIMDKHKMIILGKYGNKYDMLPVLEEYVITVWAEFCFGEQQNLINDYTKMRLAYLDLVERTYYNSVINKLPFIGSIFCKIKRFINRKDYEINDNILLQFVKNSTESSLFNEFALKFREYNDENNVIESKLIDKVIIDNAFLSIFVVDFIYMVCAESLLSIAQSDTNNNIQRKLEKNNGLKQGYLFPWRMRQISHNYDMFFKNDYVLMNIHGVELFFSFGARTCIGPKFFNKFYNHLLKIIEPYKLSLTSDNSIIRSSDINRPFINSKHEVEFKLSRDYLSNTLNFSMHKGITFYHVHEITSNPILYTYIINEFANSILKNMENNKIDGIISAEARGWLFAAPIAQKLNLPLYIARKQGKLPGNIIQKEYQKVGYDGKEIIEIPESIKHKNLVIIDDGIASGITNKALYDLVTGNENMVYLICNVIQHTYTPCMFNPDGVEIVSLFDL